MCLVSGSSLPGAGGWGWGRQNFRVPLGSTLLFTVQGDGPAHVDTVPTGHPTAGFQPPLHQGLADVDAVPTGHPTAGSQPPLHPGLADAPPPHPKPTGFLTEEPGFFCFEATPGAS